MNKNPWTLNRELYLPQNLIISHQKSLFTTSGGMRNNIGSKKKQNCHATKMKHVEIKYHLQGRPD